MLRTSFSSKESMQSRKNDGRIKAQQSAARTVQNARSDNLFLPWFCSLSIFREWLVWYWVLWSCFAQSVSEIEYEQNCGSSRWSCSHLLLGYRLLGLFFRLWKAGFYPVCWLFWSAIGNFRDFEFGFASFETMAYLVVVAISILWFLGPTWLNPTRFPFSSALFVISNNQFLFENWEFGFYLIGWFLDPPVC